MDSPNPQHNRAASAPPHGPFRAYSGPPRGLVPHRNPYLEHTETHAGWEFDTAASYLRPSITPVGPRKKHA